MRLPDAVCSPFCTRLWAAEIGARKCRCLRRARIHPVPDHTPSTLHAPSLIHSGACALLDLDEDRLTR